jgi:hypothetical protein
MPAAALAVDRAEELPALALVRDRDLGARERLAEGNRLAVRSRAARAAGQSHVERLEDVGLARAVGAVEERHPV